MATWYLKPDGNNANPGNGPTAGQAWATFDYAGTHASPGDIVIVRGGNYNMGILTCNSGTAGNPIRFVNFPGETPWMRPTSNATTPEGSGIIVWFKSTQHHIDFDGINIDGTSTTSTVIYLSLDSGGNPNNIRFLNAEVSVGDVGTAGIIFGSHVVGATGTNSLINMTIHGGGIAGLCGTGCACYGAYFSGPGNLIDGCHVYDTSGAFVHIYNGGGDDPNNNIVRNNLMHTLAKAGNLSQVWGVLVYGPCTGNQVYNNVIYDISIGTSANNGAIAVHNYASGTKVWYNTLYNGVNSGIALKDSINTEVRNNIAYGFTDGNLNNLGGNTGLTSDHNLTAANPLFVSAGTGDFRITNTSPAFWAGVSVATVTTDITGGPRHSPPSMGAYEVIDSAGVWTRVGAATSGSVDATSSTTTPIDTTTATLIVVNIARYVGISATVSFSDTYSNTWTQTADRVNANGIVTRLVYCVNPIVGANHIFTASDPDLIFPAVLVEAWRGVGTNPFGGQNGATTVGGSTLATGSISGGTNAIYFAGLAFDDNSDAAVSITQSFTVISQPLISGYSVGGGIAYLVEAMAQSRNPTWNTTTAPPDGLAAAIVVFSSDQPAPSYYFYSSVYHR